MIDIYDTKSKLEKGLNALDFLDTNINNMSNWLTKVEQRLDEFENIQFPEKNVETKIKFSKVIFIIILYLFLYNVQCIIIFYNSTC